MFENYKDIFNLRGKNYHDAMMNNLNARKNEFMNLFKYFDLNKNEIIADIPSGGGYLSNFIDKYKSLFLVDESEEFLKRSQQKFNLINSSINDLPIRDEYLDKVYSLAGSHHLEDKKQFFNEVNRILKKNGKFIYADVEEDSKEDRFLNIFVNKYNSLGHNGQFINDETILSLKSVNFQILEIEYKNVNWIFKNKEEMIYFVKNIFGLNLASDDEILNGIIEYLDLHEFEEHIEMDWALKYIFMEKI